MFKRSHKLPPQSKKDDDIGCLSGLLNIFDFRIRHSSQKLLSDRKRWNGKRLGTGYSRTKFDLPSKIGTEHEACDDVDEVESKSTDLGMATIKTLIDEEMSRIQTPNISNSELEQVKSNLEHEISLKKNHKNSNNSLADSNLHTNHLRDFSYLNSDQLNSMNTFEKSSINFDLAAFMVELYCIKHNQEKQADFKIQSCPPLNNICHSKHKHLEESDQESDVQLALLQKALDEVAKVFLSWNFVDAKQLTSSEVTKSKEFMDALAIHFSNKELFLKLLQDSHSLLLEHIRGLESAEMGECLGEEVGTSGQHEDSGSHKLIQKLSRRISFQKKDKVKGGTSPMGGDSSLATNKIIVLKPSLPRSENASTTQSPSCSPSAHHRLKHQDYGEKILSYFSFKEIKRRLRHAIGESKKDRHLISAEGVLHKIPYGSLDSGDSSKSVGRENVGEGLESKRAQTSATAKKKDKNLELQGIEHSRCSESFFYEEAKKHLTEMLTSRDGKDNLPTNEVSKSLGTIVSLPEYNSSSPRFNMGSDKELDLSPQQKRFLPLWQLNEETPMDHLSLLRQSMETITPCTGSAIYGEAVEVIDSNLVCTGEELKPEESVKTAEISDSISLEKHNNLSLLSESIDIEPNVLCERCNVEGCSTPFVPGTSHEKRQVVIPSASISPGFLFIQNLEDREGTLEKPERPSPVSVLDSFLSEDVMSPGNTTADHDDFPLKPQEIHFEEHDSSTVLPTSSDPETNPSAHLDEKECMVSFITTLLEASGLSYDGNLERWHSLGQLLDPSLYDETGFSCDVLPDEPRLLFDCINEVLVEIRKKQFSCTPWISLITPSTWPRLRGGSLVQEVCRCIDGHLFYSQFQFTVDQIIGKDMERETWKDLRFDIEAITTEMADDILEKIMEETIFELCF